MSLRMTIALFTCLWVTSLLDVKSFEKYNASFKVSFEHPKKAFENLTPEQIFQLQPDCEYKGYDKDLPFL
jgi:hypothetical protein